MEPGKNLKKILSVAVRSNSSPQWKASSDRSLRSATVPLGRIALAEGIPLFGAPSLIPGGGLNCYWWLRKEDDCHEDSNRFDLETTIFQLSWIVMISGLIWVIFEISKGVPKGCQHFMLGRCAAGRAGDMLVAAACCEMRRGVCPTELRPEEVIWGRPASRPRPPGPADSVHCLSGWWWMVAIFWIFQYIGLLIIPIDFHIFQRGGPTTNQLFLATIQF